MVLRLDTFPTPVDTYGGQFQMYIGYVSKCIISMKCMGCANDSSLHAAEMIAKDVLDMEDTYGYGGYL
jgi:hypothetical protein